MASRTKARAPAERPTPPISFDRVEAWTVSQAADVLAATSISSPGPIRGTTVTLDIPLDDHANKPSAATAPEDDGQRTQLEALRGSYKRREPLRRDSLKRREALLKGKEGSRRRQRWENDRLLSNPYAVPPLPSDWEVRPTHPVHSVPYFLAPLWDAGYAKAQQERTVRQGSVKDPKNKAEAEAAQVMKELRMRMKKAKAAKGLLQDLEKEVRGFVEAWDKKQRQLEDEGLIDPDSSDDEEIVFVGRGGQMSDERRKEREDEELRKDKLIFQSLVDDHGASFGRYLVHSIATYYGLSTWSVTIGNPARRAAYVGLKVDPTTKRPSLTRSELPRPLWTCV